MEKLKEITYMTNNRTKNRKLDIPISMSLPGSFPPMDQILQFKLMDQNGRVYVCSVKHEPESTSDKLAETVEYERFLIDFNDIREIFMILTDDQRNIVMHIYYVYKNNKQNGEQKFFGDIGDVCEENPKIILQGPAGTGKSTIINFIEKLITWEENKTSDSPNKLKVLKCAFTGKAASNIEGVTLNHIFSIPIYKTRNMTKKRLDSKKQILEQCLFFICDEISMVGERLMQSVDMRLKQIFNNDIVYGDRFVLLVGDLYQIDPVQQKPVYHPKSPLWTCCEFYELNKIIRQQDETFIRALNNFRDSQMTEEDIGLFRSREIQDVNQAPDSVIHLFYGNKRVDEHNIERIDKSNEKEETVNTFDDCDDWHPTNLRVKIGLRYMITHNVDVGDGLANGTTGVVKGFDYDENGQVKIIWMELHSNTIGKKVRSEYFSKHSKPGFEKFVPIHRSTVVVTLKSNPKRNRKVGKMFPLRAAEAITVHKSQGQTYHDGVCIHFTNDSYDKLRTDKSLQYVALTRVKRLEDLYIIGNFNFSYTSKKFIRTENELNRLRSERKLKLAYETFEDKTGDVIIFLNTGLTFNEQYQFITTDTWYGNGSLLIFTDTNTIESDDIKIPNFDIVYRSDDKTAERSGGGIICYKQANKSVEVISSITDDDDESKTNVTLLLYEKLIYIMIGDKGSMTDDQFKLTINKMSKYIRGERCIFFIGNFNIVPNTTPSLIDFLNDNNFKKTLSFDISTTNEEIRCDMVFTRNLDIQDEQSGAYVYIPSSNTPMYVKLPPKSELMKNMINDEI